MGSFFLIFPTLLSVPVKSDHSHNQSSIPLVTFGNSLSDRHGVSSTNYVSILPLSRRAVKFVHRMYNKKADFLQAKNSIAIRKSAFPILFLIQFFTILYHSNQLLCMVYRGFIGNHDISLTAHGVGGCPGSGAVNTVGNNVP